MRTMKPVNDITGLWNHSIRYTGSGPHNMTADLPLEERERLRGTGIVYIAEKDREDSRRFTGYWESERDGRSFFVEQGPEWDDPNEAVTWARERAPRVVVRLGIGFGNIRFFTAGDIRVEGDEHEPVLSWPPSDESAQ